MNIINILTAVKTNNKPNTDGYVTNAMLVDAAHQIGITISKKATRVALVTALEKWIAEQTASETVDAPDVPETAVVSEEGNNEQDKKSYIQQFASLCSFHKEMLEEKAIAAVRNECWGKNATKAPEKKPSKNTPAPVFVSAPVQKTKTDVVIEVVSRWGVYLAQNPNRINRTMVKAAPLKKAIALVICGNGCKQNGQFVLTDEQKQLCKKYYDLFLRNYVVEIGDMLMIQKNLENQLVKMGFWTNK